MTSTEVDQLPTVANPSAWTPKQANLMQFAGLANIIQTTGEVLLKTEIGVVEAFLQVCRATGLNPAVKQIYAANMGGKYTIIVGIDGMRLIAQRSGQYQGQTPKEWLTPQGEWVSAWTPALWGGKNADRPLAARVGIMRAGFREPLTYTVTFEEFGQTPSGAKDNWNVRPAHMLAIRAESHALRAAFPNELSDFYTREDLDVENLSEEGVTDEQRALEMVRTVTDAAELPRLFHQLDAEGRVTEAVRVEFMVHAGKLRGEQQHEPAPADDHPSDDPGQRDEVDPREPVDADVVEDTPPADEPEEAPAVKQAREDLQGLAGRAATAWAEPKA